jgi:hypothetical protein
MNMMPPPMIGEPSNLKIASGRYLEVFEFSLETLPVHNRIYNLGPSWTILAEFNKHFNGIFVAFKNRFNSAVIQIFNPPRYALALSLVFSFLPKKKRLELCLLQKHALLFFPFASQVRFA